MPPILFSTEEPQCDTSWNSTEGLNRFCKLLSIKVNQEVKPDNYYYKKLKILCMSRLPGKSLEDSIRDAINYEAELINNEIEMKNRFEHINKYKHVRSLLDWKDIKSDTCDISCELKHTDLTQSHYYSSFIRQQQKFRK